MTQRSFEETDGDVKSRNYDAVASFYELLANAYSFGLIRRAKMVEFKYLKPGQRVLYLGVGSGEEAVTAARKGLEVTAIDLSSAMIERLRGRLARKGLRAELIVGDALLHRPREPYDAVCGNYFFNVFGPGDMPRVLRHAVSLVRPGGRLMVADMAPPPRGARGLLTWAYLKFGLSFFWLLRLASQHPIYDFRAYGAREGLELEAVRDFGLRGLGMPLYRTVVMRRPGTASFRP
ncbi:MAG: class I SAM-dependent methyltransferase [Methylobacterium mesophilicum]|nr:class I SAM-dependent methyltransferase [Methylobacterium mesophilicum]